MWHDIRTEQFNSFGSPKNLTYKLLLSVHQNVETVMFLTDNRVRVHGNQCTRRGINDVTVGALSLPQAHLSVARTSPSFFPAQHRNTAFRR